MKFISALLHHAAARVRAWCSRSPAASRTIAEPVQIQTAVGPTPAPECRRPKHLPQLWTAKCSDTLKWWCGPVAVAATIGVDVAAVRDVIKRYRAGKAVKGTYPNELQLAFRHFGYDMALVADLRSSPPTLATWERERKDMEAAYVVIVTDHWVAVRGKWLCDTFTRGVPVKIKNAPHRRKRVRFVYRVTIAPRV